MTERLELPVLVAGERVEPEDSCYEFSYEGGYEVVLPKIEPQHAERMVDAEAAAASLRDVPLDDLTIFFEAVGRAWMDPENPWRRRALEWGTRSTGYAQLTVEWDVNQIGTVLARAKQYDFLESDLGDPGVLDEWTRHKAIFQRCWPKGLIAHVMVGNVPMAALFTLYRSLITKNVTIAKLPRRDVVTSLCFANCIHDTGPDHPVTRALSTVYWEAGSEVEQQVVRTADVVSVWGRGPSIEALKRQLPYGTDLIEFGPKRSFCLVLPGVKDFDRVGMRMAYDVITYDQEGCFSMQEAFVLGEVEHFREGLCDWLGKYAHSVPRRPLGVDGDAHIQRARLDAEAAGWDVFTPEDGSTGWTVVITDQPTALDAHPLSRFVYVHPTSTVDEVIALVDRDVQTVSFDPWDEVWQIADGLTAAGVDRIVQVGRMGRMRPGFIHDGFHPMRRMVRWAAVERGLEYKYRFMSSSPDKDEDDIYRKNIRLVH